MPSPATWISFILGASFFLPFAIFTLLFGFSNLCLLLCCFPCTFAFGTHRKELSPVVPHYVSNYCNFTWIFFPNCCNLTWIFFPSNFTWIFFLWVFSWKAINIWWPACLPMFRRFVKPLSPEMSIMVWGSGVVASKSCILYLMNSSAAWSPICLLLFFFLPFGYENKKNVLPKYHVWLLFVFT